MPSRYDDFNLNNGEYIPQYAGSALEDITKTSEALQDRHYKNIADLSNLQLLKDQYESKVTPGAKDYIRNQFQDIGESLKEMAKNGAENSTSKVAALRNRFLGDQGVLGALQRSEEIKKEVELENQLIGQGKTPIRKKGLREQAMNTPVVDPVTGQVHELYTRPYQSTVTPYENPVPYMKDIWAELHPDSIEGNLKGVDSKIMKDLMSKTAGVDGVDIPLFFESLTKAGIDKEKITSSLNNAFDSYKETPAYKQAIEYSDNPQAEDNRQKKIFYEHGLLKVFNNISRQYMGNPIADDVLRKGKKSDQESTQYNPDLSITTPAPKTPLDHINQISEKGDIIEGLGDKAIRNIFATPEERKENEKYVTKLGLSSTFPFIEEKKGEVKYDEAQTIAAIPYYKAAAEYANLPNASKMDQDQLKAWAGSEQGRKHLKVYKDSILEAKYRSPIIENINEEKARDAHNLFVNSSLSQRKMIPFDDINNIMHMSDLTLDKANNEMLNISKWYVNDPSKIRVVGKVTPQNWLGEGTDVEGEFTNGMVVEVPQGDGKDGKVKRYYVSNLPSETSTVEVTEKALSNLGKKIPGVPNKGTTGIEVYQPINQNGLVALANQYNNDAIKDMRSAVVVKYGGHTIIAPDYATAAIELEKLGVVVTTSK